MIAHLSFPVIVIDNDTYQKHEVILPMFHRPVKKIALNTLCLAQESPKYLITN